MEIFGATAEGKQTGSRIWLLCSQTLIKSVSIVPARMWAWIPPQHSRNLLWHTLVRLKPYINVSAQQQWLMLVLKLKSPSVTGLIPWLACAFSSFKRIPLYNEIFISPIWQFDVGAPCGISDSGKISHVLKPRLETDPKLFCRVFTVNRADRRRGRQGELCQVFIAESDSHRHHIRLLFWSF